MRRATCRADSSTLAEAEAFAGQALADMATVTIRSAGGHDRRHVARDWTDLRWQFVVERARDADGELILASCRWCELERERGRAPPARPPAA